MEYIKESFDILQKHLLDNGLSKGSSFELILSLTPNILEKKIYTFFLGVLVDRDKTQSQKVYKIDKKYELANNYFDIYFALYSENLDDLALISRILVDFEEMENIKFRLLNSKKELQDNLIVQNFLRLNTHHSFISSTALFVKVSVSAKSLKQLPSTVLVSDIKIDVERKKI